MTFTATISPICTGITSARALWNYCCRVLEYESNPRTQYLPFNDFSVIPSFKVLAGILIATNEKNLYHSKKQYRGADKSLARPGRKQATATEDFDFHISYL